MQVTHKTFSGGYRFKNFAGRPEKKLIKPDVPPTVTIPLKQGFGGEVTAVVKPGDTVEAGQIIGENKDALSCPVHASVGGSVEDIIKIKTANTQIDAVVIKTSEEPIQWQRSVDWSKLSSERIQKLLYQAGVTSLDRRGIPTIHKSSITSPDEVQDVIINGVEAETFNLSFKMFLEKEEMEKFVEGIKILKTVMPKARFHIVLDDNNKGLLDKFNQYFSSMRGIRLNTISCKHPANRNEVLIPALLGKEYPMGCIPADAGVIVLSIQTVLHAYEAVVLEKPVIERTIALGGPGWKENVHLRVPIGTKLTHIVKEYLKDDMECRLVMNSLLTGEAVDPKTTTIDKTTEVLIALPENRTRQRLSFLRAGKRRDSYSNTFTSSFVSKVKKNCETNVHGEHRPCLSCGFCEEVCPADIVPHLLYRHVERNMLSKRVEELGIFKCIQCNLCSYVCTSKINIAKHIKEGQQTMEELGFGGENHGLKMERNGLKEKEEMQEKEIS